MRRHLVSLLGTSYRSGSELARRLGVSRVAVWKQVQRLVAEGYPVEVKRGKGYRLAEGAPSPALIGGEAARTLGREFRYLGVISSTQDEARAWAAEGAPAGSVVVAEGQTAGRGRRGRSWASPTGKGLYCSVILRSVAVVDLPFLSLAAGVALAEASGVGRVRWPNDIVAADGAKLGGVLVEAQTQGEEAQVAILGLGLNVGPTTLPEGAASLSRYLAASRLDVLKRLIARLEHWLGQVDQHGQVLTAWRERDMTMGHPVRVRVRHGVIEGRASAIRSDGTLVVTRPNGEKVRISAGDVELLGTLGRA